MYECFVHTEVRSHWNCPTLFLIIISIQIIEVAVETVGNSIRNKLNCLFHVCLTKLISKNFELFARFFSFLLPYFPSFLIYPIIHLYYKPNANFIYTFISSSCFFFSFSISSLFRFIVNLILKTFIPWSTVLVLSLFLFRVFFCISFSPVCWPFVHV